MKKKFFKFFLLVFVIFSLMISNFLLNENEFVFCEKDLSLQSSQIKSKCESLFFANFEDVQNRTAGTDGEKKMGELLAGEMSFRGLNSLNGLDSFEQKFSYNNSSFSQNIVGMFDNNKEKYVIFYAHYDSVFREDLSYGFNDNLSGVLAVLNLMNENWASVDFNVVFVFFGAEEVGLKGSEYFVQNLQDEIKNNILLAVNFDSVGYGDKLYYFTSDYKSRYGNVVNDFAKDSKIQEMGFNRLFSTSFFKKFNYSSLALNSDNSSFLIEGINSLFFFAGNLESGNGFGFYESEGKDVAMHKTDSKEQIEKDFSLNGYYDNIATVSNFCYELVNSENFSENFRPNQINPVVFSPYLLKGIGFVLIGFAGIFVVVFYHKKKNAKN